MADKYTNRNESFGNLPDDLRVNPFAVPDRYFEDLTKRSLLRNKLRQDMEEASNVPNGYFDNLQQDILSRVYTEQLKTEVSDPGMAVPDGYFERLSDRLLATTTEADQDTTPAVPVETPVRRMPARKWLPYVAASCLALVVGIGAYLGLNPSGSNTTAANSLQAVPDQEIISYLELYAESDYILYQTEDDYGDLDEWLEEGFSEADIEAYFNNRL